MFPYPSGTGLHLGHYYNYAIVDSLCRWKRRQGIIVSQPFRKVFHQGMITASGAKMSKSNGNAVNPDDYDPDELRMYLMFLGPYADGGDWNPNGIIGIRRFLNRMSAWLSQYGDDMINTASIEATIDTHLQSWKVNKVVSSLMEFYNAHKSRKPSTETASRLSSILNCFAPTRFANSNP